jgi:poly(3-hydroxybutyrate) depolymerase
MGTHLKSLASPVLAVLLVACGSDNNSGSENGTAGTVGEIGGSSAIAVGGTGYGTGGSSSPSTGGTPTVGVGGNPSGGSGADASGGSGADASGGVGGTPIVGAGGSAMGGSGDGAGGDPGSGGSGFGGDQGSGGSGVGGDPGSGGSGVGGDLGSGGSGVGGDPGSGGSGVGGDPGSGGSGVGGSGTGGDGGTDGGAGGTAGAPAASAGCGQSPTLMSGTHSIQTSGQNRSFILSIPDDYDSNHPYRLIFAFHWNGGTAEDIDSGGADQDLWSYYGLRALSDNSTIFVAPQGLNNGWANSGGQDITFVDDMIRQVEEDLCVDTTRLFSVGFSYGGGMSYALACARATVFRAVAVYSGAQLSGCSDGTQPIAYLGIHGISDGTCNISGGRSLRDRFVSNNGCTAQNPPEPSQGSLTHTCTSYTGCSSGHPVRWCAFDGGHTPGAVDGGGDSGARTWTKGEVWDFFTQF